MTSENHVAHPRFGETVDINNPIREVLKAAPALCSTDASLLLRDRYETTYGICNHATAINRPLLLIAMHDCEDSSKGSILYERLNQFAEYCVAKHFGLSLAEFLELPTDVCNEILNISDKRQRTENSVATNLLNELELKK
jgi:hypothetical protein